MDVNFRFVVILVASVVILILLVDAWLRERRKQAADRKLETDVMAEMREEPFLGQSAGCEVKKELSAEYLKEDLIVINVFAKNGASFSSYDLLQAISATGMQYGPMNIFHYYDETPAGRVTLFNLASATEPGDFDLDHIGDLSCAGLTLFMNLRRVPDANEAFEIMLDTAEQLAEDLEGDLFAGHHVPWNNDILLHYQNKVSNYQTLM